VALETHGRPCCEAMRAISAARRKVLRRGHAASAADSISALCSSVSVALLALIFWLVTQRGKAAIIAREASGAACAGR
jgi:uncharacterized protein YsxB (DUF464 family)